MNPDRVRLRGLQFSRAIPATLSGVRLTFDKASSQHSGVGHANIAYDRDESVEGVLYLLDSIVEIAKMDPFEHAPVNYSREVVCVATREGELTAWTYFANPGVLRTGLVPPRRYLQHLLAGESFLSAEYFAMLSQLPCEEAR